MRFFRILSFYILSVFVFSCRSDEHIFFKGDLIHIDITSRIDTLKGNLITLEEENYGMISVYDSLIFFYNPMDKQYQYRCYNYETGKHVANFFPIGRGEKEFINVTPIHCIFYCGDTVKSIFVAANEQKIGTFNITQSILHKKSILENVSDFKWNKLFTTPITKVYPINGRMIGYVRGCKSYFQNDSYTLPKYIIFDKSTWSIIDTIELYHKTLIKELNEDMDVNIFGSFGALKPDGSKIASAMNYLPQINIWDIKSNKIKGIRFGKTTFWDLIDNPLQAQIHHVFLDVDDEHIYVPYFNDTQNKSTHFIHVFSWTGDHVAQYYIEEPFDQIQIEPKSQTLFTYSQFTNKLYCYKIPCL